MRTFAALIPVVVLAACDGTPPEVVSFTPNDGADLRGVGFADVNVGYRDDSDVTVTLSVDGFNIGEADTRCLDEDCFADAVWETATFDIGEHVLHARLEDSAGNVTEVSHTVIVDDVLEVVSMHLGGTADEIYEIEVYAFEGTSRTMVGCAGSRQNLGPVDTTGMLYETDAILIDANGRLYASRDMAQQQVRLEVWEDDDDPVCPVNPDPYGNDMFGATPARTAAEWRTNGVTSNFGSVLELGVVWSRRLQTGENPGTPNPTPNPDPVDFGGGGCSAGAGAGAGSAVPALGSLAYWLSFWYMRRRRSTGADATDPARRTRGNAR